MTASPAHPTTSRRSPMPLAIWSCVSPRCDHGSSRWTGAIPRRSGRRTTISAPRPEPPEQRHGRRAVRDSELANQAGYVTAHRHVADPEPPPDVARGKASVEEHEDFPLAVAQRLATRNQVGDAPAISPAAEIAGASPTWFRVARR